jgi:hypothetical protein
MTVSGGSTYQPLSRGLAELVTTDLARRSRRGRSI